MKIIPKVPECNAVLFENLAIGTLFCCDRDFISGVWMKGTNGRAIVIGGDPTTLTGSIQNVPPYTEVYPLIEAEPLKVEYL